MSQNLPTIKVKIEADPGVMAAFIEEGYSNAGELLELIGDRIAKKGEELRSPEKVVTLTSTMTLNVEFHIVASDKELPPGFVEMTFGDVITTLL